MNKKVKDHFKKVDPVLFVVAQKVGVAGPRKSENYFENLVKQIINQQLSDKAGETIYQRFKALFKNATITPQQVLQISTLKMRKAGPSGRKIEYVKGLAKVIIDGQIDFHKIKRMSDEEVIIALTKVRGIGRWTAEMFLMSSLGREDIFSHGDLGLARAIRQLYHLEKPTREEVEAIAIKWSPYRTYACRLLWRSLDE